MTTLSADLPTDLRAHLESVPPVTPEMIERVAAANRALNDDPAFQAELRRETDTLASAATKRARRAAKPGASRYARANGPK